MPVTKSKIPKHLYQVILLFDWDKTKNRKSFNIKQEGTIHVTNVFDWNEAKNRKKFTIEQKNGTLHLITKKQLHDCILENTEALPNVLVITINTQKLPVTYEPEPECKEDFFYGKHYHISKSDVTLDAVEQIDVIETHQFDSPNKYGVSLRYLGRAADHACNKSDKEKDHITPLHTAAYEGTAKKVSELLKKIDVNSIDTYGWSPLHDAVVQGDPQIVTLLLNAGADVNAQDNEEEWTPLHDAVRLNRPKIVHMLLDAGADPSIKDKWGKTPEHYAKEYKFNETLKILSNYKKC